MHGGRLFHHSRATFSRRPESHRYQSLPRSPDPKASGKGHLTSRNVIVSATGDVLKRVHIAKSRSCLNFGEFFRRHKSCLFLCAEGHKMTETRVSKFAAAAFFAAALLAVASPAYAWGSRVDFSGRFVAPYATVGVYGSPYIYPSYGYYRPYRTRFYARYPYPYYRPYYRSYNRPYYPVRRFYVRSAPIYYGPYCPY